MTTLYIKLVFCCALVSFSLTENALGSMHTSYLQLPNSTTPNTTKQRQINQHALIGLNNAHTLARFYSEIVLVTPEAVTFRTESLIYRQILKQINGQIQSPEMSEAPKYVRQFARKWALLVIEKKRLVSPIGLDKADHLLAQLQFIEHFLAKDLTMLNRRFSPPKGLQAISNAQVVIHAAQAIGMVIHGKSQQKVISEAAKSISRPLLSQVFTAVLSSQGQTKNQTNTAQLLAQINLIERSGKLVDMEFQINHLVNLLKIGERAHL